MNERMAKGLPERSSSNAQNLSTHLPQQVVLSIVRDYVSADDRGAPAEREYVLGDYVVAPLHLHHVGNLDHRVLVGLRQVNRDDPQAAKWRAEQPSEVGSRVNRVQAVVAFSDWATNSEKRRGVASSRNLRKVDRSNGQPIAVRCRRSLYLWEVPLSSSAFNVERQNP